MLDRQVTTGQCCFIKCNIAYGAQINTGHTKCTLDCFRSTLEEGGFLAVL